MKSITIEGLTRQTKNRITNKGKEWFVARREGQFVLLVEARPKDVMRPYCFWGEIGVDFKEVKYEA